MVSVFTVSPLAVQTLTSSTGKMTMQVLAAVAEFERDLLIERTQAGLARAKSEGKKLGRPKAVGTIEEVKVCKAKGLTQAQTVRHLSIGLTTVKRYWKTA